MSLFRIMCIIAWIVALILAGCVVAKRSHPAPDSAPASDSTPLELVCLSVLSEAYPSWIKLTTLTQITNASHGDIALELAGNPSVQWKMIGSNRYYRLRQGQ